MRHILRLATLVFLGLWLVRGRDPRLLIAAGAFGTMWLAWDYFVEFVLRPIENFAYHLLSGGVGSSVSVQRPSLDDTVRLLEHHLANPTTTAKVDINAAIRLEEIYRMVKKDPARAQAVIETVRQRYPEAPELQRFRDQDDE